MSLQHPIPVFFKKIKNRCVFERQNNKSNKTYLINGLFKIKDHGVSSICEKRPIPEKLY